MRFVWANFDGILEMNGEVEFPKNKVVVIYGANLQGKTNLINAIRYTFLREAKKGRKRTIYDDWALPTRQEVVSNGKARIDVVFEHDGEFYRLCREVSAGGRRDVPILSLLNGWPGKKVKTLDLEPFVKERLKAGLLDALFAPEIAGGFKRLYGKDIDEAISEVFKEVVSARQISRRFIQRLEKLKSGAEAETARIAEAHRQYCDELLKLSKALLKISEFKEFQKFRPGATFAKIMKLLEAIRTRIKSLEKDELFMYLKDMVQKSDDLLKLKQAFSEEKTIKNLLAETENISSDIEKLEKLILDYQRITSIEDRVKKPPDFQNPKLSKKIKQIFEKITTAQHLHQEAKRSARKYRVNLETLKDSIKELGSIISVLSKKRKISEERRAAVTKIGRKAYAVVPIKLLATDATFTSLSDQPIPKGSEEERNRYLKALKERYDALVDLSDKEKKSARIFNNFKKKEIAKLSRFESELKTRLDQMRKEIDRWANKIITHLSAFTGVSEKARTIENEKAVDDLLGYAKEKILKKKSKYLKSLNEKVQPLGLEVKNFRKEKIKKVLTKLEKERLELPAYRKIEESFDKNKEEWRLLDEIYVDFSLVPKMVKETIPVLNAIIRESVDETKLKEAVATTYNQIIKKMKDRKLIEAVAEMSKESIQAKVKYRGKMITHPGGAEKAFFSLAILTALGHYFRMPILIDEVANNLDTKNLPAFFSLVIEFMREMQLQYVLSIKETKDFDLDGWVKDIAEDIVIYEVKGKNIQKMELV